MHGFLRGFWGTELRPLCLLSKHFINKQIVSLAPGSASHMSKILVLWLVLPDQVQHD